MEEKNLIEILNSSERASVTSGRRKKTIEKNLCEKKMKNLPAQPTWPLAIRASEGVVGGADPERPAAPSFHIYVCFKILVKSTTFYFSCLTFYVGSKIINFCHFE